MPRHPRPSQKSRLDPHRLELRRLAAFALALSILVAATYVLPGSAALRPWITGEPLPLVGLVMRQTVVREDEQGNLTVQTQTQADAPQDTPQRTPESSDSAAESAPSLPVREPALPTPLVFENGAMDHYFAALAMAEAGYPGAVVRTLHWGDSTIAGDGITGTVRDRLQARFGDAGPGFLAVAVDPRWSIRPGIARWSKGDWDSLSITFGGADQRRYGLAGTVATAMGQASVTLGGRKRANAQRNSDRQLITRFDVYTMRQPGGGGLTIKPRGAPGRTISTNSKSDRVWDDFTLLTSPRGSPTVWLKADGTGPVTVYGVALETSGPGLTWENFGVAGSGQGSILNNQSAAHLAGQVARRHPQLIVYQTGGNELGYPSLAKDDGALYRSTYTRVLARLKAGAPDADCLVVTPLDQATRQRGQVVSKPLLSRMVDLQSQAALDAGCAFWDARGAMGGDGAFARWLNHQPRLAWTDLMHLTDHGLAILGDSLADAIEQAYDQWKLDHEDLVPPPYSAPQVDGLAMGSAAVADPAVADPASGHPAPRTPAPPAPSP
ncbi:MAG: hypothetical protein GXP62_09785 [Oligoflexia bacterium]|nr:hypothetical protein [Oligoflexia bacterium]